EGRGDAGQERYMGRGRAGLQRGATRRGRKPPLAASVIERAVKMTLHENPPAATHWSARTLAKALGISHTSVQRIWNAHGLNHHNAEPKPFVWTASAAAILKKVASLDFHGTEFASHDVP